MGGFAGGKKKKNALVADMGGGETQVEWILFVLGVVLSMASTSILVGFSQTTAIPYYNDRMYEYAEAICNITNRRDLGLSKCACDVKRRDSIANEYDCEVAVYPCLSIEVLYWKTHKWNTQLGRMELLTGTDAANDHENTPHLQNAILYVNLAMVKKFRNENKECSYYVCEKNPLINRDSVRQLNESLESATKCYYNSADEEVTVRDIVVEKQVIHTLLWPSLFLFVGIILFLGGVILFYRKLKNVALEKVVDEQELARRKSKKEAEWDLLVKNVLVRIEQDRVERQSPIQARQKCRKLRAATEYLNSLPDARFRASSADRARAKQKQQQQQQRSQSLRRKPKESDVPPRRASDPQALKFLSDYAVFSQPGVRLIGGKIILR